MPSTRQSDKAQDPKTEDSLLEMKRVRLEHTRDLFAIKVTGAITRWKHNRELLEEAKRQKLDVSRLPGVKDSVEEIFDQMDNFTSVFADLRYRDLIDKPLECFVGVGIKLLDLGHEPVGKELETARDFANGIIGEIRKLTSTGELKGVS